MQLHGDVFISLVGLEERVLGVFRTPNDLLADKYVIFINDEFSDDNRVVKHHNLILKSYLKGKDVYTLKSSYLDGLEIVRQFNTLSNDKLGPLAGKRVLLDSSTFNRQNLLVLLRLLRKIHKVSDIDLVYTLPEKYNENLSQGLSAYMNVPFFGGRQFADRKKLLILLMGYEEERALAVWEREEPNETIIIEGYKPTLENFLKTNREKIAILQSAFGQFLSDKASANDPHEAENDLIRVFRQYVDKYNIVVTPLNTKIQTIGLYLAWESYPDIRIVQALPAKFSEWLSKGIGETLVFHL